MIDRRDFLRGAGGVALCSHLPAGHSPFRPARSPSTAPSRPVARPTRSSVPSPKPPRKTLKQAGGGGEQARRRRHAGRVAHAQCRPDGYTLAQLPMGMFRIPHMQKTQTFDPIKDFTYVVYLTGYTFGLVVPADSPIKSIKDLVDYAKANPGQVHLRFDRHRHHRRTWRSRSSPRAPASSSSTCRSRAMPTDAGGRLGGHVMAASDSTGWAPYVESGRLRLLATYGSKRTKRWPDVPTLQRTRLRDGVGLAVRSWRPARPRPKALPRSCTTLSQGPGGSERPEDARTLRPAGGLHEFGGIHRLGDARPSRPSARPSSGSG